jgi:hypothetical protein
MVAFELDRAFPDFNFSEWWDPALQEGPSASSLYKLVYQARKGDRFAAAKFADAMSWTLRPETWDCFQRIHGHRPIAHREWFYAKLAQYIEMLVYDDLTIVEPSEYPRRLQPDELLDERFTVVGGVGSLIQTDELEQALVPDLYGEYSWFGLVQKVIGNPGDRAGTVRAWLREQSITPEGKPSEQPRSGWRKNQERDQIILNCLDRGMASDLVSDELDKRTIPTLPALQTRGIHRWRDGWADPKARNAIQQLFSKLQNRKKPVKSAAVSN